MYICRICNESKQPGEFYAAAVNADGVGVCKSCWRARVRLRRRVNPKVQEYDRLRASQPKRRSAARATTIKWRAENPTGYKAQTAVGNAIRDGRLDKQPCATCGETRNVRGFHPDYSRPLEVTWLCAKCHCRLLASSPDIRQKRVADARFEAVEVA